MIITNKINKGVEVMCRTQRDIEQLLREIPLNTAAEEKKASDFFGQIIALRNEGITGTLTGTGIPVPVIGLGFSIPNLIIKLKEGNYVEIALALMGFIGDAMTTFAYLVEVAIVMETIPGVSGMASAGVVSGMAALAIPVVIATGVIAYLLYQTMVETTDNISKSFYITDASGILTSWMFQMPEINPHSRLEARARTAGYYGADISEICRLALSKVSQLWRSHYEGNQRAIQEEKRAANNDWEQYWINIARGLEQGLRPWPDGIGLSMVVRVIRESRFLSRDAAQRARQRRLQQQQRRAAGGYVVPVWGPGGWRPIFIDN